VTAAAWAGLAQAAPQTIKVQLNGAQEVPPVETAATGTADLTYDPATRVLTWTITYSGMPGGATMGHIHGPAPEGGKGPVLIWLSKQGSPAESPFSGQATLTPEQAQQLEAGEWYINLHAQAHPAGEIRGQIKSPKS
jgi:hypothetical protein